MKTKEEILLKYTPYIGTEGVTYENILKAMNEIEQQTRDEVLKFTDWYMFGEHPFIAWIDEKGKFITDEVTPKRFKVSELFDYWQLNIKEKP